MQYAETYQRSISEPEVFWAERINYVPQFTAPQNMLGKDANGAARWFADGISISVLCC